MDPVSQAAAGALFAQTAAKPKQLAKAATIGALAGMAPDLDVLFKSATDPLLALEYHRQFTHALLFIPLGALLCSLVFQLILGRWWRLSFKQTYLWSLLGVASHGLLDSFTSYGTQLLWPFTNYRVSWDLISIIDPVFTLPLIGLILAAALRKQRWLVGLAVAWAIAYLSLGFVQHERAIHLGEQLAQQRGHTPVRLHAKPSFANLAVWKIIYETDSRYYVAAVKPGLGQSRVWEGDSVAKLDLKRDLPWLDPTSQQARDIERFRWFSQGFIALDAQQPNSVADMRYSLLPQQIAPLWGVQLDPTATPEQHVYYYTARREAGASARTLWQMIWD